MNDIVIYGAGGLGREVACLINNINAKEKTWNLLGFFDDGVEKGVDISHYGKVLGNWQDLNNWRDTIALAIAVGSPKTVMTILNKIDNKNVFFPNLIHPNVRFADIKTFKIGKGNIIKHDCGFSCDDSLEDFNLLNGGITFGHDVHVGSFNTFMPDVRISGDTTIIDGNFFGVGSISLQGLLIGNGVRLGAASVLMRNPKDNQLYIGNPATKIKF